MLRPSLMKALSRPLIPFTPFALALLVSTARAASGAEPDTAWTGSGIDVSPTDSLVRNTCAAPDGAGGEYVAWIGQRGGIPQLFLQHLSIVGKPMPDWPVEGQLISSPGLWSDRPNMVIDGTGGVYLAWDSGSPYGVIYYRHVPSSGALTAGWAKDSARVILAPPDTSSAGPLDPLKRQNGYYLPMLASDGLGGAYLTWQYNSWFYGPSILVRRIKPNGDPAPGWLAALWFGLNDYHAQYQTPVVCGDGEGGAFIAWKHGYSDGDIYAAHAAGDGTILAEWVSPDHAVCSMPGDQSAPGIAADGAGGAYVVWQDERNGLFQQTYIQHLSAETWVGAAWPESGIALCSQSTEGAVPIVVSRPAASGYSSVATDGAGGAFVAWTDHRAGIGDGGDIFAQHILSDGTLAPGWTQDGTALCTAFGEQKLPTVASDGAGGAIVTWQDARTGGRDICAQHVDAEGAIAGGWAPDGALICGSEGDQLAPFICADPAGGALIVWQDGRRGASHAYAARLSPDGAVATLASLVSAEATPERVHLVWSVGEPGAILTIERRLLKEDWVAIAQRSPDGVGRIEFEDRDVLPATRYGYRLCIRFAGEESFAGETWVDVPALRLAITRVSPNPSRHFPIRVDLVLADGTPAQLDLLDVAGRRVAGSAIGAVGPGAHSITVHGTEHVAAGIYWLRLSQGGAVSLSRTVLLR